MFSKLLVLALAICPLVTAHGKVAVVTGNAGGNGTALAIKGAIVPGPGPNSKTEVDTTVFANTKILTDGLGHTTGQGKNKLTMLKLAMALSGPTLPQVSSTNGTLAGTFHIVTTDGAGPLHAVLDPTGTGSFSNGTLLTTLVQVPGKNGNIKPSSSSSKRSLLARAMEALAATGMIGKRAANVNEDLPMEFAVPSGTVCEGTVEGVSGGVCLVKIANSNKAGPFGGVVAIQIAGTGNGTVDAAVGRRGVGFVA